ncbi:MAG: YkgJ family cysteine cluster protein [Desulfobacteraceae bacterium]
MENEEIRGRGMSEAGSIKAFSCRMCGECCRGEGGITITSEELERMASYLGISAEAFKRDFCVKNNGRLSIATGDDGFCSLYEQGKGCTVHPVKPERCAIWPFYPALLRDPAAWREAMDACPGINPECPFEEFVRQAHDRGSKGLD